MERLAISARIQSRCHCSQMPLRQAAALSLIRTGSFVVKILSEPAEDSAVSPKCWSRLQFFTIYWSHLTTTDDVTGGKKKR